MNLPMQMKQLAIIIMIVASTAFMYAAPMVYTESALPPDTNVIVSLTTGDSTVWNNITPTNNDGIGTDSMYGQSFRHMEVFDLYAVSVRIPDTKSYGAGQTIQLALLKNTTSDNAPDTLVGSVYSADFTNINGSTPWKTFTLPEPVACAANTAYAFVFTLPGPVTNNLRVTTDTTAVYTEGNGITTGYSVGTFPEPLPPSLNGNRDIYFVVQGTLPDSNEPPGIFVAPDGDDGNASTFSSPLATLQAAAGMMLPGDTCYIRGGTYHQETVISGLAGADGNEITFTNYEDEVVIFDGTRDINDIASTGWTQHSGSIYKTTLTEDVWQLFVNGEWMVNARWPNANFSDGSIWDHETYWAGINETASVNGTLVDRPHNGIDLAASGLDMTGAMLIEEGRDRVKPITSHSAGSNMINHELFDNYGGSRYYVECKLNLLDAETEWFFDTATKELYLCPPGGAIPTGDIRGKVQTYAITMDNCSYVNIEGLNFFGTTIYDNGGAYIAVEDCNFQYPSCSKRMLGGETSSHGYRQATRFNSSDNCYITNCTFENTDSEAIYINGTANTIENCYFHNIDFTCSPLIYGSYSAYTRGLNNTFNRNTAAHCGSGNFLYPGSVPTIMFNHMHDVGINKGDSGVFHMMIGSQPNCNISYNWIYDAPVIGARFDAPIPPIRWGSDGLVHHNVLFDVSRGAMIKGEYHETYSNTAFDASSNDITVLDEPGADWQGHVTRNNAAGILNGSRSSSTFVPLPGTEDHNFNGMLDPNDLRTLMRDPANFDFRPIAGSILIDTGQHVPGITDGYIGTSPDRGAYEYADTNYWIPGRKLNKASTPIPPNATTNAKSDCDLMWLEAIDAVSYNVYFSTDPVLDANDFQGDQTNNIFSPGTLTRGRTYYWRIDAVTPDATITGDEWSFRTAGYIRQVTLTPIDDAFVDVNSPDDNFGGSSIIDLKTPASGYITKQGYLKFNIPAYAGTITDATLRLHTVRTNPLQGGASVYGVSDTSWDEDTITWNNQPGIDGDFIASGEVAALSWGDFDLSSYITENGFHSLGLIRGVSISNRSVDSKESDHAPELVITYDVTELGPDINGDGAVNSLDLASMAIQWLNNCGYPDWCDGADLNLSGEIGLDDLNLLAISWLDGL